MNKYTAHIRRQWTERYSYAIEASDPEGALVAAKDELEHGEFNWNNTTRTEAVVIAIDDVAGEPVYEGGSFPGDQPNFIDEAQDVGTPGLKATVQRLRQHKADSYTGPEYPGWPSLTRACGGRLNPETLTEWLKNSDLYSEQVRAEYADFKRAVQMLLALAEPEGVSP